MSATSLAGEQLDEFWALFGAELEDYLGGIETVLAATPVDPGRVDELFRAFHSVKGGSAALALHCIEKVAHAAEDLLHQVRAGRCALSVDLVTVLLEAVDEMRRLQGAVMSERRDQPLNQRVVDRLKSLRDGMPAATAAAPVPPAAPAAAHAPMIAPEAVPVEAVRPPAVLTVSEDGLAGVQNGILAVLGVVDAGPESWGEPLAELAAAANEAGLCGIAQAAGAVTAGGIWGWVELVTRLLAAELATAESMGAGVLAAAFEGRFGDLLTSHAAVLRSWPDDAANWLWAARLLAALELDDGVELADAAATRRLLAMQAGEEVTGLDETESEAIELFALAGMSLASGISLPRDELAALRVYCFGGAAPAPRQLAADGLHAWPAEALERLAAEIAAGKTAALALLDLERNPEAVAAVSAELFAVTCLYNRSRLDIGAGTFEYLLAVEGGLETFAAALAAADPKGVTVVRVVAADGQGNTAETAPMAGPPAQSQVPAAGPASAGPPKALEAMVRVPAVAIDTFMDTIGEMRLGLTALTMAMEGEAAASARPIDGRVKDELQRLERTVRALYDNAIALRVAPVGLLFNRLLRPIRDTAVAVGKEVGLTTAGEDVQVDKAMIEMLVDPLTHIVRNAVDHGIESPDARQAAGKPRGGSLRIHARQGPSVAVIDIEDDGGGIDVARVRDKAVAKGLIGRGEADALSDADATQLILLPGFSTRDTVSEISGRGVGMDIVLTAIKKLGGRLVIDSRLGAGTRFTIEFPISAAMQRVLAIDVAGRNMAVHERAVREVVVVAHDRFQRIGRRMTLSLRGRFLPVADFSALLGFGETLLTPLHPAVVVVIDDGNSQLGLLIEGIPVRREVFFKTLHPLLERHPLLAGAAVNGAGRVLFACDAAELMRMAARADAN